MVRQPQAFPGQACATRGSPAARNQPWREVRETQTPGPQGAPHLMLSLLIDSGMGVGRGVPRLLLEFSYLRVFQLSFSMWFSGPSLSKGDEES